MMWIRLHHHIHFVSAQRIPRGVARFSEKRRVAFVCGGGRPRFGSVTVNASEPCEVIEPAEETGRELAHLDGRRYGHEEREDLEPVGIERFGLGCITG